jgi:hypothetical protein
MGHEPADGRVPVPPHTGIARMTGYDVFLSCKQTGPDGKPTRDSAIAQRLESELESRGVRCFRADSALRSLARADYSRAIMETLDRVPMLVVVATSAEYVRSEWVRAEWETFLNELRSGRKHGGVLVSVLEGLSIGDLPIELRQFQCFRLTEESLGIPCDFIEKALMNWRSQESLKAAERLVHSGQESMRQMDSLRRAMAESRITELEITAAQFGPLLGPDYTDRLKKHIADLKRSLGQE